MTGLPASSSSDPSPDDGTLPGTAPPHAAERTTPGQEPSILFLTMAMFGGYRSLIGMVIATAVLESATEYLRPFGEYRMIAYGTILLFGMMFFPKGILTLGPSIKRWVTRLYSADARS